MRRMREYITAAASAVVLLFSPGCADYDQSYCDMHKERVLREPSKYPGCEYIIAEHCQNLRLQGFPDDYYPPCQSLGKGSDAGTSE